MTGITLGGRFRRHPEGLPRLPHVKLAPEVLTGTHPFCRVQRVCCISATLRSGCPSTGHVRRVTRPVFTQAPSRRFTNAAMLHRSIAAGAPSRGPCIDGRGSGTMRRGVSARAAGAWSGGNPLSARRSRTRSVRQRAFARRCGSVEPSASYRLVIADDHPLFGVYFSNNLEVDLNCYHS